jgi:hypothetical protein
MVAPCEQRDDELAQTVEILRTRFPVQKLNGPNLVWKFRPKFSGAAHWRTREVAQLFDYQAQSRYVSNRQQT